jgi:DNA-binding NarL/FixJ family response regulator
VTLRVLLVDDEELLRTGFRLILAGAADIDVVAEAADGRAAVDAALRHRPDVVLMDIRMPTMDGLAATREILRTVSPAPRIVVLTTFDLDDYVYEALLAGASGFLLKDLSASGLADAVRAAAGGDALLAPSVTRRLIEQFRSRVPAPADQQQLDMLTDREGDVFAHVVAGRTNAEIADALFLAEPTVKTYVGRLLTKLDCRDRVQLVIRGYELGVAHRTGTR